MEKKSILVKIFENFDFHRQFRKNFDFSQKKIIRFLNISIIVDFCEVLEKFRFLRKFRKFSIIVKIWEKNRFWAKSTILVRFSNIFDFGQNLLRKYRKILNLVKFAEIYDFFRKCRKISILVKFSKIFHFADNSWKVSIFWKIWKSLDLINFSKNLILVKIFAKFRF